MTLTTDEIDALLATTSLDGGVVQKVFERDAFTVVFQIRLPGESKYLLFSASPRAARFHLVDKKPTQPKVPSGFTMGARKYLVGRYEAPRRLPGDRIVEWAIAEHRLIAELTNHPALILLDSADVVLAHTANPPRRIRAGEPYQPATETGNAPTGGEDRFAGDHDAAARWYDERLLVADFSRRKTDIAKRLRAEKKRQTRLITNLESDLEKCVDATQYQTWGTLLQQAYGTVERGASAATVTNYYDPELATIEIPLDPGRSIQQNIDRYFHQFKRLTAAFDAVSDRLELARSRRDALSAMLERCDRSEELGELETIESEARAAKLLRAPREVQKRGKEAPTLPYREYRSQTGAKIWVGRGAKHNDQLTTQFTKGRDIWLHARDWAGAHVVLKTTLERATSEDLLDAAVLTAHFSKGSSDTWVEVTYTEGKHVRKPKGAAPGLVTVSGGKTVTVRPDDPRLQRLLGRE